MKTLSVAPGEPISSLAARLDIGARRFVDGQTHVSDIRQQDVPVLLTSIIRIARERGLHVWIRTRRHLVAADTGIATLGYESFSASRRIRVFVADSESRLVENICLDIWKRLESDGTWRALPVAAPVTRFDRRLQRTAVSEHVLDSVTTFPVDAVITWVNAADPGWRALVSRYREPAALDPERFIALDELRYCLRSIDMYAPWIRRVHVLTNCAPPDWFVPSDRYRWVDHSEAIPGEYLPIFNSDAIETFLHRIPGIADHLIYFNDDFLLAGSVFPSTFFTWDGRSAAFLTPNTSTLLLEQLEQEGNAKEFQGGRVNGARLLEKRFGAWPTLVHRHAPFAISRTTWERMEADFPAEIEATRRARFREPDVITWTAFTYPHYALATGLGFRSPERNYEISPNTVLKLAEWTPPNAAFAVVAPTVGGAVDPRFHEFLKGYLPSRWPFRSGAERSDGAAAAPTGEGHGWSDVWAAAPSTAKPTGRGDRRKTATSRTERRKNTRR